VGDEKPGHASATLKILQNFMLVMIRAISFLETSSWCANVDIRSHDLLLATALAGYPNGLSKFHTCTRIQDVVEREQVIAS